LFFNVIKDSICLFPANIAINLSLTNNNPKVFRCSPIMALYLVPFNGMQETEVKSAKGLTLVSDLDKETKLADALQSRGVFALTSLTDKGVLVSGTQIDARQVGNVMADGMFAANTNRAPSLMQQFGAAVVPFKGQMARRPSITGGMHLAA
jgi:hypothetical protein